MKATLNQILHLDNDEPNAEDVTNVAPAPSLEERSNILLNALYGSREFTTAEYARTRNALLDTMASKIGGRNEFDDTDDLRSVRMDGHEGQTEPALWGSYSDRFSAEAYEMDPDVRRDALRAPTRSSHAIRSQTEKEDPTQVALAAASALSFDDKTAVASRSSASQEPLFRVRGDGPSSRQVQSRREVERRSFSLKSATIGSFVTLGVIVVACLPFAWMSLTSSPSKPGLVALFRDTDKVEIRQRGDSVQQVISESNSRLVGIAERLLVEGDLHGARLVLTEAAEQGSAAAALRMGITFDPTEIRPAWKNVADPAKARNWYLRAKELGSADAQLRLDRLGR